MKQIFLLLFAMVMSVTVSVAQTDKNKKQPPKPKPVPVYFGGQFGSGNIPTESFKDMLHKRLLGKDSTGKEYKVNGFTFTYVERNLYEEESAPGVLKIIPDYLMEYCYGDTFNSFMRTNISQRAKGGDTVYIDNISLISPDGHGAAAKSLKLVITK